MAHIIVTDYPFGEAQKSFNQPQVVNDVDIGLPEDDVPQSPTVWWFGKAMRKY